MSKYLQGILFASIPFILCILLVSPAHGVDLEKEYLKDQYNEVIREIKDLERQGYDVSEAKALVEGLTQLLVTEEYDRVIEGLSSVDAVLAAMRLEVPDAEREKEKKLYILIYADVILKLAFIVVVVFVLVNTRLFRTNILTQPVPKKERFYFFLFFTGVSFIGFLLQTLQFGSMSLVFVDPQLVLVMIAGIFGGVSVGILCGTINSFVRLMVIAEYWYASFLPIIAGCIGACIFLLFRKKKKISILYGMFGGAVLGFSQALLIYIPIFNKMTHAHFIFSVVSLIVLNAVAVFLFLYIVVHCIEIEKMRKTTELFLRMKLQFLQAQINPHFLFNVLNTIAAVWQKESEVGRDLIIKLSSYLRNIVGRDDIMIPLREELDNIQTYLEIEGVRFKDRLKTEVSIQVPSSYLDHKIPILVIQPLVENALNHGLKQKVQDACLTVRVSKAGTLLRVDVIDNGSGMSQDTIKTLLTSPTRTPNDDGMGIGLNNVHERLVTLYGSQYGLRIESEKDTGTTVSFHIPMK